MTRVLQLDKFDRDFWAGVSGSAWPEVVGETVAKRSAEAFSLCAERMATAFREDYLSNVPKISEECDAETLGFESRLRASWSRSLAVLTAFDRACFELGDAAAQHLNASADEVGRAKAIAVVNLQARCLRVAGEILALMRAGYADGAYARWRTLHELAVVLRFIASATDEIATRFLLSRVCRDRKGANEYDLFAETLNLEPFEDGAKQALNIEADEVVRIYGKEMQDDWGWALPHFNLGSGSRITFEHIREAVKMDHWRPYSRMANDGIHASFVPHDVGLGVRSSKMPMHLVGPSDAGLVEPGRNMAITLCDVLTSVLLLKPTLDCLAFAKGLRAMVVDVQDALIADQKEWDARARI